MNAIQGMVVGKISKAGQRVSNDGRKPFAACAIKLVREWQGKEYFDTVKLITYRDVEDIVPRLTVGTIVAASGDVGIEKWEYQGKTCACNKIVGTISILHEAGGANREENNQQEDAPF